MAVVVTANDDTQLYVDHTRVDQTAVRGCGFMQKCAVVVQRIYLLGGKKKSCGTIVLKKNLPNSKLHIKTVSLYKCFQPSGLEGGTREEFSGICHPGWPPGRTRVPTHCSSFGSAVHFRYRSTFPC